MALDANDLHPGSMRTQAVNQYFDQLTQLRDEVIGILTGETKYIEKINQLETELSAYKRAYADVDLERKHHQKKQVEAEQQRELLEYQLNGHRVVTLIDGDGALFNADLISQGIAGGLAAAQKLSDSILQYMSESSSGGAHQYQIWVYIFYNKRGLVDTFGRLGYATLKTKFDDFVMGFNQAAERFLMVDVGNGKEAADAKIKAHLEDDIRLPQTCKVLFAGCHDNGYVSNLRSQITAGYKQKLVLLKSYTEMAAGISDLDLPTLTIPDLFMTQKLGAPSAPTGAPRRRGSSFAARPLPPSPPPPESTPLGPKTPGLETMASNPVGAVVSEPEPIVVKRPAFLPPTYSFAVKNDRRSCTPDLDASRSSASSDSGDSDDLSLDSIMSQSFTSHSSSSRRIDPNLVLSKQKPPPCTLFYLASCKHGSDCKYAHDYLLDEDHYREIRTNAKKAPCPYVNKGETCIWAEDCCYGHTCPSLGSCYFLKKGKCKFVGVDMHKDPKTPANE
ncbi:hypothetical protein BDZ89DRAFT_1106957 [Hymenopellis radicata]|nr:hypothetical protein BDZ89DRAFT_1106957 [Hymenopellis radicata]